MRSLLKREVKWPENEAAPETEEQDVAVEEQPEAAADDVTQEEPDVAVQEPDFPSAPDTGAKRPFNTSLDRLRDVQVVVSATLGTVSMTIGELLELGEGSTIELDRSVNAPVDLIAQGCRIGSGEVVVINDCFAIRIRELADPKESELAVN